MRVSRLYWVLALGLTCGCKHESTITTRSSCFDICLDASAHVDVEAEIGVASDVRDSFERARAGLSAYTGVAAALTQFVQSMVELKAGLPSGLNYQGGGVYALQPDPDTRVQIRFYLPVATRFGSAGSVIDFNLFDPANYFASLGVKTEASIGLGGVSTRMTFTFASLGPGAELLGISPSAASPLPIDIGAFSSHLASVVIGAEVGVTHSSGRADVAFSLAPEQRAVSEVGSASARLSVTDFSAQGFEFAQTIRLDSVDLRLQNPGSTFDGLVRASAISPDFGFQMLLSYNPALQGNITLGCLGVDL